MSPVLLHPGETYWVLDEFRSEPWVDILGYQSGQDVTEDALRYFLAGPISRDWEKDPFKPFINISPLYELEGKPIPSSQTNATFVRRLLYWSFFNSPPVGVSYGADGIWNWLEDPLTKRQPAAPNPAPHWRRALTLPVANQIVILAALKNLVDLRQLVPARK